MLGSTVVQNTTFVLIFSSKSVSGCFSLVSCSPCIIMCRYPIVVFTDFSRWLLMIFIWGPNTSSGNFDWLPLGELLQLVWKVLHVNTGLFIVLKFVPECCLPNFMIVVSPGALPTFQSSCFCSLWLFIYHSSGLTSIVCLVWLCIHNNIELLMILMGLSAFLGKCGPASLT